MTALRCRLFGHVWESGRDLSVRTQKWTITFVGRQPVFHCRRCPRRWWGMSTCRTRLTRRDHWLPYPPGLLVR